MKLACLWMALFWFGMDSAHAAGNLVPGSRYTSGRGAAMGDAFIAHADDGASALFYNPAALGKLRHVHLEPMNIQVQANSDYLSNVGLGMLKFTSLTSHAPVASGSPGPFPGGSAAIAPNFSFRGFGFGVLMENRIAVHSTGPEIRYRSKYQVVPAAGASMRLASGVMRIGYVFQMVNLAKGDVWVPTQGSSLSYRHGLNQGFGFSHNVGWALTLPYQYLPALNIVARNIGNTKYAAGGLMQVGKNSPGAPDTESMTIDSSVAFKFKTGAGTVVNLAAELKDGLNASNASWGNRASFGMEFGIKDTFFIRGGFNDHYPSAGIGMRRPTGELNLSWFSEEMGAGLRSERDIRYMMHYAIRAF